MNSGPIVKRKKFKYIGYCMITTVNDALEFFKWKEFSIIGH